MIKLYVGVKMQQKPIHMEDFVVIYVRMSLMEIYKIKVMLFKAVLVKINFIGIQITGLAKLIVRYS